MNHVFVLVSSGLQCLSIVFSCSILRQENVKTIFCEETSQYKDPKQILGKHKMPPIFKVSDKKLKQFANLNASVQIIMIKTKLKS